MQFILVDKQGYLLESDNIIFVADKGNPIADYHPFFLSIAEAYKSDANELTFHCINLSFKDKRAIVDIKMLREGANLLLIIHDLTEYYDEYQTVAQARNESIIKSELIILKNKELKEREQFKNKFIQNFSHELRNPLTNSISITNALSVTKLNNDQKQMVDFLKESNTDLKLMLDDILGINMISSGKIVLRENMFELLKLTNLLYYTYKIKANSKGLEFLLDYDERLPKYLIGDRLRLFQILTNLLENAIKYTDKGRVSLKIMLNQKRAKKVNIRFSVSDTGIGIPEGSQDAIFESFKRLDYGHAESGVGLGLSIVKKMLELMNSEIKLDSVFNEQSHFYFDLGLKYQLFEVETPPNNSNNKLPKQRKPLEKKLRILVVEDDLNVQRALFKTLVETKDFYIELIADGSKVLQELVSGNFNLILMDVNLVNTSGDTITKIIRELPMNDIRKIPILGVTANAFKENIDQYLAAGMNAVITKPYEDTELLEAVYKLCKVS